MDRHHRADDASVRDDDIAAGTRAREAVRGHGSGISMSLRHSTRAAASLLIVCAAALHTAARPAAADDQAAPPTATKGSGVAVTIYPLLVRAPIFGAEIDLPTFPSPPGT